MVSVAEMRRRALALIEEKRKGTIQVTSRLRASSRVLRGSGLSPRQIEKLREQQQERERAERFRLAEIKRKELERKRLAEELRKKIEAELQKQGKLKRIRLALSRKRGTTSLFLAQQRELDRKSKIKIQGFKKRIATVKKIIKPIEAPILILKGATKTIKVLAKTITKFEEKQARAKARGDRTKIQKLDEKITAKFKKFATTKRKGKGNEAKRGLGITERYFKLFGVKFYEKGEREREINKFMTSFNKKIDSAESEKDIKNIIEDAKNKGIKIDLKITSTKTGTDFDINLNPNSIAPTNAIGNAIVEFTDLVFKGTLFSPLTATVTASKGGKAVVKVVAKKSAKKLTIKKTKKLLELSEDLFKKKKLNRELNKISNDITKLSQSLEKETKINNLETLLTELKNKDLIKGFILDKNTGAIRFIDKKGIVSTSTRRINPQGQLIINIENLGTADIPKELAGIIKASANHLSQPSSIFPKGKNIKFSIRKSGLEGINLDKSNLPKDLLDRSNLPKGLLDKSNLPPDFLKDLTKSNQKINSLIKNIKGLASETKQTQKTKQKMKTLLKTLQKLKEQQKQASKQKLKTLQKLKTKLKTKQKLKSIFKGGLRIKKPPRKPPTKRIIRLPPFKIKLKGKRGVKKTKKKRGYTALAKTKKKFKKLNKKPLSKINAKNRMAWVVDKSISQTGRIKSVGKVKKLGKITKRESKHFSKNKRKFRSFKIRKGRKKPLKNKWIEKRKFAIDTVGEKRGLSAGRVLKQLRRTQRNKPLKRLSSNTKPTKRRATQTQLDNLAKGRAKLQAMRKR